MSAIVRFTESEADVVTLEALDAKVEAQGKSLDEVKKDVREVRADVNTLRDQMHAGFASMRGEMHAGFASVRGEMHAGFAAVRGEMHAGFMALSTSVAELRATIRTVAWIFGVGTTLAILFLNAGKVLHWFETPAQALQGSDKEIAARP